MTFQIGGVFEASENGELRRHAFATLLPAAFCVATAGVSVGLVVHRASEADRKREEAEEKERAYQKGRRKATSHFFSAFKDERALQVQRLVQGDLKPHAMWHIFELIRADIGSEMKDLVPVAQQKRFRGTVNSPVIGEGARHLVAKGSPPSNPMSLEEARNFTRTLTKRYLEKKAGLPASSDPG